MDARTLARAEDVLSDDVGIEALNQAWLDSKPGTTGGTEQGGFVAGDDDGVGMSFVGRQALRTNW